MHGSLFNFFFIADPKLLDFFEVVVNSIRPPLQKFSSLTGIIVLHLWQDEFDIDFFSPSLEKSIFLFQVFLPPIYKWVVLSSN